MIDCYHLSEKELARLGIVFSNSDEAKAFICYIKQRLDAIIWEDLFKQLHNEGDQEDKILTATRVLKNRNSDDFATPEYLTIVKRAQTELIWNVFIHRDELERATINHDVDQSKINLQKVGLSRTICMMLMGEGINTIGDLLNSNKLSIIEKSAPSSAYEVKESVLNFLFPDAAPTPTAPVNIESYKTHNIYEVFRSNKNKEPDEVLEIIRQYMRLQAQAYCNGELSLNEFIILTYSPLVARELMFRKSDVVFNSAQGVEDNLLMCYNHWKINGEISADHKMETSILHSGDFSDFMIWFFTVIDTLLIPIEYYCPVYYFCDLEENDCPNIITEITGTTERFFLSEECLDIDKLLMDMSPEGKTFNFIFNDETTAKIKILEVNDKSFVGYGIIDGYMSEEGEIEIVSDNGYWFYFDKKTFSDVDVVLMTSDHPIPHPKWTEYNKAVKRRKQIIREKYDEKREDYIKSVMLI